MVPEDGTDEQLERFVRKFCHELRPKTGQKYADRDYVTIYYTVLKVTPSEVQITHGTNGSYYLHRHTWMFWRSHCTRIS